MKKPNTAQDAVGTRLIALSYMEAVISGDEDFMDMVTNGISTEDLLHSIELLTSGLISIIAHKMDVPESTVINTLRESSLKSLRENG